MNAHLLPGALLALSSELRIEPGTTLPVAAAAQVSRAPTRTLMHENGEAVTFAELWSRAQQIAGGLANTRVIPGQTVAVALPRGPARLTAELAIGLLGATFASLDHEATTEDAVEWLAALEPDLILVPRESPIARLDIPVTDLGTVALRDDRKPRPVAANSIDAASIARRVPGMLPGRAPRVLTHAQVLGAIHGATARMGLQDGDSFHSERDGFRLEGSDPGWLALVTGTTWLLPAPPPVAAPRPIWRRMIDRLGLTAPAM